MKKNNILAIIAVCAAIGAAVAAVIVFREEIADFVKNIIAKLDTLRSKDTYNDCCFDESWDDFDDFEDVPSPF